MFRLIDEEKVECLNSIFLLTRLSSNIEIKKDIVDTNSDIFNKVKQTNLERYGVNTFLKTEKLDEARKTYNYNQK